MEKTSLNDNFDINLDPSDNDIGNEEFSIYPADIKVDKDQYSFFQLKRMLEKYNELKLNPDFQREFVWSLKQQSELIESILMNIPLPLFYFAMDKKGIISVVDGLQRLTTVFTYMQDNFSVGKVRYLKSIIGKRFSDLQRTDQAKIEKYQIQAYIIQPSTPENVKLDIFDRINKSGTALNKQEMRNALYMGKSTKLLKELSILEEFTIATDNKLNEKRMRDRYVVLRFISFFLWRNKDKYPIEDSKFKTELSGDIDDFLAQYMQNINNMDDSYLENIKNIFKKTMQLACKMYKNTAFMRDHDIQNPFNMIQFESLCYILASFCDIAPNRIPILKDSIEITLRDSFFQENLSRSPNAKKRLEDHFDWLDKRIKMLRNIVC